MNSGKKEILPYDHYPFRLIEEHAIAYVFQTETGVQYEVKFKPSSYIFPSGLPFSRYVYEFSLLLGYQPPGNPKIASDKLIPFTIAAIFTHFYERFDSNNITVYICDSSDSKQHIRKRKFDQWFTELNKGMFIKIDQELKDSNGVAYPVAIIFKPSNPYRMQIFDEFIKLIDSYNNDK